MQPYQQRVVDEKIALDEKISKLTAFFETPMFQSQSDGEKNRLMRQCFVMGEYSEILRERIDNFT